MEVTERCKPVAVLQPISPADDPISELVARGLAVRKQTGERTGYSGRLWEL